MNEPQESINPYRCHQRALDYSPRSANQACRPMHRRHELARGGNASQGRITVLLGGQAIVDRQDVDAWIEAQKELEELKKAPALTDGQAQAFFEGVEKEEDGNIIVCFGSEED